MHVALTKTHRDKLHTITLMHEAMENKNQDEPKDNYTDHKLAESPRRGTEFLPYFRPCKNAKFERERKSPMSFAHSMLWSIHCDRSLMQIKLQLVWPSIEKPPLAR